MKVVNNFVFVMEYCVSLLFFVVMLSLVYVVVELFEVVFEDGVKFGGIVWSYAVSMYVGMNKVDEVIVLLDCLEILDFM